MISKGNARGGVHQQKAVSSPIQNTRFIRPLSRRQRGRLLQQEV
jgi:hypothetical protein